MNEKTFRLTTPIALIVFNRPDITKRVFIEIKKAKPSKLLVVADGPREDKPGEAEKVKRVREIIEKGIDWECEVMNNCSDVNLGCKKRVLSGIDWVFHTVEEAIILEDDCLPHPSFFRYCQELLKKYRDDERISMISGDNFGCGYRRSGHSYYFSQYTHVWGWASWRRAWKDYDVNMKLWPMVRDNGWLIDLYPEEVERIFWKTQFDKVYEGKIDTWDYQWAFANRIQGRLSIMPNVNLISNIGFNEEATHTKFQNSFANMTVSQMDFPLSHPSFVICDSQSDQSSRNTFLPHNNIKIKCKKMMSQMILQIRKMFRMR